MHIHSVEEIRGKSKYGILSIRYFDGTTVQNPLEFHEWTLFLQNKFSFLVGEVEVLRKNPECNIHHQSRVGLPTKKVSKAETWTFSYKLQDLSKTSA